MEENVGFPSCSETLYMSWLCKKRPSCAREYMGRDIPALLVFWALPT